MRAVKIAFAYVGVIIGAGLSSGQDIMQYFLSFGRKGLMGIVVLGILNTLFGLVTITLGSYFQAKHHDDVLKEIAPTPIRKLIDITLVFTGFAMSFVMIAGAGSNLRQQFHLPFFVGGFVCSALIIVVAFLDFERILEVIGVFTPLIVIMIAIITVYTFAGKSYDYARLDEVAKSIRPATNNVVISVINYFALCAVNGVSMAFVMGGSEKRIKEAKIGGALGGFIVGLIVIAAASSLFAHLDIIKDADIPMLVIVNRINKIFALIYAITIFALIFNTTFSLYFATARRFDGGSVNRMRIILIALVVLGYICSFFGFKTLVSIMYPILGYMGIIIVIVLGIAWVRLSKAISEKQSLQAKSN